MRSVLGWVRSLAGSGTEDRAADGDSPVPTAGRAEPSLFYCESCDTVYVATEKSTCASCDAAVETVPSDLPAQ